MLLLTTIPLAPIFSNTKEKAVAAISDFGRLLQVAFRLPDAEKQLPPWPPAATSPAPDPAPSPAGIAGKAAELATSRTASPLPSLAKLPPVSSQSSATTAPVWNTRHLGLRLAADAASGFTAASLVAPVIATIDRAIMENASGANTLGASLRASLRLLLRAPHQLVLTKPFALIVMLYGGTYLTANAVDTAASTRRNQPASTVTAGTAKFAASSAANIGLCIYKDQVFVRLFGPPGVAPRPVPLPAYGLFALRDAMTIFASFIVPPRLGPYLQERVLSTDVQRLVTGATVAQFAAPALTQLVSTPVHLLGLDLYNRPWATTAAGDTGGVHTWSQRFALVSKNWLVSTAARVCRIVPAFGVGGVVNTKMRRALMTRLE
ncbi:hypothetical protein SPI_07438 [Niveomyces insectorum RCEF 264]|uniref:Sequence orphan n=1 Tax=Niveomyces insectorum RCEF 264 TaxID=1081102 RepID=A0A167PV81_9HYPO|nr:hypothetical protein SPI_07438 [Niveomyces insectorum RCEF 264]